MDGKIDLTPLAPFYPLSDRGSLGQRFVALNIIEAKRKRALLLYQAGEAAQDIFDSLANGGDHDDYEAAILALDNYFTHKRNLDYDIFHFRTLKQDQDEEIDQCTTNLNFHISKKKLNIVLFETNK